MGRNALWIKEVRVKWLYCLSYQEGYKITTLYKSGGQKKTFQHTENFGPNKNTSGFAPLKQESVTIMGHKLKLDSWKCLYSNATSNEGQQTSSFGLFSFTLTCIWILAPYRLQFLYILINTKINNFKWKHASVTLCSPSFSGVPIKKKI